MRILYALLMFTYHKIAAGFWITVAQVLDVVSRLFKK
jgi:hypothetical protein